MHYSEQLRTYALSVLDEVERHAEEIVGDNRDADLELNQRLLPIAMEVKPRIDDLGLLLRQDAKARGSAGGSLRLYCA